MRNAEVLPFVTRFHFSEQRWTTQQPIGLPVGKPIEVGLVCWSFFRQGSDDQRGFDGKPGSESQKNPGKWKLALSKLVQNEQHGWGGHVSKLGQCTPRNLELLGGKRKRSFTGS